MKQYDKYLLKKLFQAFSIGVAIYSVLFLIQNLFVLSEVIVEKQAPIRLSLLFVSMFFPKILSMTFPFAVLFAALFVGTQASSNSELVAFTTTGISPARQLRPYWLFTGVAVIVYALLLFQWVPLSKTKRDTVFNEITRLSLTNAFIPGEFSKIGENSYLMATEKPTGGLLKNVVLFSRLDGKNSMYSIELAKQASFPTSTKYDDRSHLLSLKMVDGNAYVFGKNEKQISSLSYREKMVSLNIESFVSGPDAASMQYLNRLPWFDLQKILVSGSMGARILFLKRILLLFFIVLAPTLAFLMSFNLARGEGRSGAFVASFAIAFVYFIVAKLFEGFSLKIPSFAPALSLSISCIFLWITYKHYVKIITVLPDRPPLAKSYRKKFISAYNTLIKKIKQAVNTADHFQRGTLIGYIRFQFLRIFISVLMAMEGIYMLAITLVNLPKFLENHATLTAILGFLVASLPPTLPYVLPFSFVVASLFYFSWMDSKSELVAIKSLGVSVYKACAPVLQLALILSVFMIFVNTYLSPVFLGKSRARRPQAIASSTQSKANSVNENNNRVVRSSREPELSYYYEDYKELPMTPVTLFKLVSFKFNLKTHQLEWACTADKLGFKRGGERLIEGERIFNFYGQNKINSKKSALFVPDNASFFSLHRPEVDEMTSYQLRKYISNQKNIGVHPYQYITSYYDRFSTSFSPLILLLVGLPFVFMGKGGRRKSPAKGIAAGIILVVIYYAFASLFHSFGAAHYLPPFLAAWLVNLLFLFGGLLLFTEVRT